MPNHYHYIIFGGNGDLARRKLLPALYRCEYQNQLPETTSIVLTTRRPIQKSSTFIESVENDLISYLPGGMVHKLYFKRFLLRLKEIQLDPVVCDERWIDFKKLLDKYCEGSRVFYFAIPPHLYSVVCANLAANKLNGSDSSVVLEKPIGYSLQTANELNGIVAKYFPEDKVFRIDHYLGKETVQNLLALRFSNLIFEQMWNAQSIDHVQITIAESIGLEGRAGFYETMGALRDMVQNHMLQLLALISMETPHKMDAASIHREKVKVLEALRLIAGEDVRHNTVRGQYVAGFLGEQRVCGYIEELEGQKKSETETYVAIRCHIDNWRWAGVPFYLRTGKRLPRRQAEIIVQFRQVPHRIYPDSAGTSLPNRLVIRLQPDERIQMTLMAKQLDSIEMSLMPVDLSLELTEIFRGELCDAYQRLLLDVGRGDTRLFIHQDEIKAAWAWIDPIIEGWKNFRQKISEYPAGSWGPAAADELIHKDGRAWFSQSTGSENVAA